MNKRFNATKRQMLGDAIYIWSKRKSKKVHIASFNGTACKLENQGKSVIKRLRGIGNEVPEGRVLCLICKSKYFTQ